MAVVSLVLGIMSWVVGGFFCSLPGVILAKMEIGKIERGESSREGETLAKIGFWLSVANLALSALFVCLIGGYLVFVMALVGGIAATGGGGI